MTADQLIEVIKVVTTERPSKSNGYGIGIYRWVGSYEIQERTNIGYDEIRKVLRKAVKLGKLQKRETSSMYARYSLAELEGYRIEHDYLIEED